MIHRAPLLLVEDNPDDVFFMQRASRQAEIVMPLHVVNDGQAAIDYLGGRNHFSDRSQFPIPGLMLLDLKLPYKSGHEVVQWTREQQFLKPLPIVIFTTSAEESDVETAYRLGANGYLVKPANMNELIQMLKALKHFWLDYNILPRFTDRLAPA